MGDWGSGELWTSLQEACSLGSAVIVEGCIGAIDCGRAAQAGARTAVCFSGFPGVFHFRDGNFLHPVCSSRGCLFTGHRAIE